MDAPASFGSGNRGSSGGAPLQAARSSVCGATKPTRAGAVRKAQRSMGRPRCRDGPSWKAVSGAIFSGGGSSDAGPALELAAHAIAPGACKPPEASCRGARGNSPITTPSTAAAAGRKAGETADGEAQEPAPIARASHAQAASHSSRHTLFRPHRLRRHVRGRTGLKDEAMPSPCTSGRRTGVGLRAAHLQVGHCGACRPRA